MLDSRSKKACARCVGGCTQWSLESASIRSPRPASPGYPRRPHPTCHHLGRFSDLVGLSPLRGLSLYDFHASKLPLPPPVRSHQQSPRYSHITQSCLFIPFSEAALPSSFEVPLPDHSDQVTAVVASDTILANDVDQERALGRCRVQRYAVTGPS